MYDQAGVDQGPLRSVQPSPALSSASHMGAYTFAASHGKNSMAGEIDFHEPAIVKLLYKHAVRRQIT